MQVGTIVGLGEGQGSQALSKVEHEEGGLR